MHTRADWYLMPYGIQHAARKTRERVLNKGHRRQMPEEKNSQNTVLCGANSYTEKYYFNEQFGNLPQSVKDELQVMCVLFTEDIGGIFLMEFTPEGNLEFRVEASEEDYLFDEIGSGLKVRQYRKDKRELLEALETYYRLMVLKKTE